MLQTPCTSFRFYSSPRVVWRVMWEVKNMPRICKSSYGAKLFSNIFVSTYVKGNGFRANRYEQMKYKYMFTGTLQGYAFFPRASQQYFVYRRNFNCPHSCLHSTSDSEILHTLLYMVHYIIFWGKGDRGCWLCDVASLVMYCIGTKSLYRTALPFSIINDFC